MSASTKVRDRLAKEYGLQVLRVTLASADSKPLALFTLTLADGSEAAVLTASMQELGFDEQHLDQLPYTYMVPPHIVSALRYCLADGGAVLRPLWLRLSAPLGWLGAVPWEELLQPALGIPMLRLPHQAICPRIPASDIDTLVCFSAPIEEKQIAERFDAFIDEVPVDLAMTTHFHLFADHLVYPKVMELKTKYQDSMRIDVYPLPSPSASQDACINPWVAWIREAMGAGSVDVVHFLCHCTLQQHQGVLALAASPHPTAASGSACLLTASDLVELVDYLGAWCVAFTSSPAERSAAGMRLLQTDIALRRPGPVLVHDMNVAGSRAGLDAAYRFLFTSSIAPPATPAVSLCCHPVLLLAEGRDRESAAQLERFTLASELDTATGGAPMPQWLKSTQRRLEASASSLADAPKESGAEGRLRARKLVLRATAKYARLSGDAGNKES
jgi:hypothetical protein